MIYRILLLLIFIATVITTVVEAQNSAGSLEGTVFSDSGERLPGATVQVERLGIGRSTNEQGTFRFDNLESGSYTLRVSLVGFDTQTADVTIRANETTSLRIELTQPHRNGLSQSRMFPSQSVRCREISLPRQIFRSLMHFPLTFQDLKYRFKA